jgi:hypothetical protein
MTLRRIVLVVLLIVSIGLLVTGLVRRGADVPEEAARPGLRVIVVGVDGLDWFLLARYVEAGRMPTVARLLTSGVSAEVAPEAPSLPSVAWPALAAGTPVVPAAGPGRPERRYGAVPRLADIVANEGGTALAVGWPASWPAAERDWPLVAGYAPRAEQHVNELAPSVFPDGPGHASSDAFEDDVRDLARRVEERAGVAFERIVDLERVDTKGWEDHLTAARWSHLADLTMLEIGAQLIAQEEPDLALVYLPGLDAVSHRFLAPAFPEFFSELPDEVLRFENVLPRYYEFIDRSVERLLRLSDDRTVIILCSAYGFAPSLDAPRISGSHAGGPPGVCLVRGPRLSPLPEAPTVSSLDIAPTVLAILGVEIPDDIEGRIIVEALPAGHRKQYPPTFGPMPPPDAGVTEEPAGLASVRALAASRLRDLRSEMR